MPDLSPFSFSLLSLSSLSLLLRRGLMRSLSVFSVLLAFLQVDSSLINSSSVFSVLLVFLQVLSKFPKILPEFPSNSPQELSGALPRTSYTPRSLQVLSPFSSSSLSVLFKFSLSVFFKFSLRSPSSSLQDPPRSLLSVPPCIRVKQSPMEKAGGVSTRFRPRAAVM